MKTIILFDKDTKEVITTGKLDGDVEAVKQFLKTLRDVFFPNALIKTIDADDPQLELI